MSVTEKDIAMLEQIVDKIEEVFKAKGIKYKRLEPTREQKIEMLEAVEEFLKKTRNAPDSVKRQESLDFMDFMKDIKSRISKNEENKVSPTSNPKKSMNDFFNDLLKNQKQEAFPKEQVGDFEKSEDDLCTCPVCLNYHNFEEKLGNRSGKFDKTKFLLAGKVFHAKSFTPSDNSEDIVVLEKEENLKIDDFATLKSALDLAIKAGDLQGAQNILDRMSNLKK